MNSKEISVSELKTLMQANKNLLLLDVRTYEERQAQHIGGIHIPLQELPERYQELDKNQDIVIYCRSGGRSMTAVNILSALGFMSLKSLSGGINAWLAANPK